jgi:hypothetical protein
MMQGLMISVCVAFDLFLFCISRSLVQMKKYHETGMLTIGKCRIPSLFRSFSIEINGNNAENNIGYPNTNHRWQITIG